VFGVYLKLSAWLEGETEVAVDLDLTMFCDRVTHETLLARVARQVRDKMVLWLTSKELRAGGPIGESPQPTEERGPHGSPPSPLLYFTWV
jgi:RNA-directed DNA polymerase